MLQLTHLRDTAATRTPPTQRSSLSPIIIMASFSTGDAVGAVVADIGHYATKIGWAGDDTPRSYFRSVR